MSAGQMVLFCISRKRERWGNPLPILISLPVCVAPPLSGEAQHFSAAVTQHVNHALRDVFYPVARGGDTGEGTHGRRTEHSSFLQSPAGTRGT